MHTSHTMIECCNMAETKQKFVIIRVLETTRSRIKVKAARERKMLYEIAEEMSKNECL